MSTRRLALRWTALVGLVAASWVAAGDNDWPQRYGDAANTNTSHCWLEPPLVEVWRAGACPHPAAAERGVCGGLVRPDD